MIRSREIGDFLTAHGVTAQVQTDGYVPSQPDRLVVVTITGGAGTRQERMTDTVLLAIRCRGNQNDNGDAEALAEQVDDVLMGAVPPLMMGAHRVQSIDYSGGQPAFIARDSARRASFSCNYLVQVSRTVF